MDTSGRRPYSENCKFTKICFELVHNLCVLKRFLFDFHSFCAILWILNCAHWRLLSYDYADDDDYDDDDYDNDDYDDDDDDDTLFLMPDPCLGS